MNDLLTTKPSDAQNVQVGRGVHVFGGRIKAGTHTARRVVLGSNTFVGYSAVLEQGAQIGTGCVLDTFSKVRAGQEVSTGAFQSAGGLIFRLPTSDGVGDIEETIFNQWVGPLVRRLFELFVVATVRWPLIFGAQWLILYIILTIGQMEWTDGMDSTLFAFLLIWIAVLVGLVVMVVIKSVTDRLAYGVRPFCCIQSTLWKSWAVENITMPTMVLFPFFEVFIDNSFLMVKFWQLQGADIRNPASVHLYDVTAKHSDTSLYSISDNVVVQTPVVLCGHANRPDVGQQDGLQRRPDQIGKPRGHPGAVFLPTGPTSFASGSVLHPGCIAFEGLQTKTNTLWQSGATNVVSKKQHVVDWGDERLMQNADGKESRAQIVPVDTDTVVVDVLPAQLATEETVTRLGDGEESKFSVSMSTVP